MSSDQVWLWLITSFGLVAGLFIGIFIGLLGLASFAAAKHEEVMSELKD